MNNENFEQKRFGNFEQIKDGLYNQFVNFEEQFKYSKIANIHQVMTYMKNCMRPVRIVLDNINIVQQLLAKINTMPVLDPIAVQTNKNSQKLKDNVTKLRDILLAEYNNLQQQLITALMNFNKDIRDMDAIIVQNCKFVNLDAKDAKLTGINMRSEITQYVSTVLHELRMNKDLIPDGRELHEEGKSSIHSNESQQVNDIFKEKEQQVEAFEQAVTRLDNSLKHVDKKEEQVKLVANQATIIKKEIPPKTVKVTKDGLEKLRHSTHLIVDLNIMDELLKAQTMKSLINPQQEDTKTQKRYDEIAQRLAEIENLIEASLSQEQAKSDDLMHTVAPNLDKMNYGKEAIQSYSDVLHFEKEQQDQKESLEVYKKNMIELGAANAEAIKDGLTASERVDRQFEHYKNYGQEISEVEEIIKGIEEAGPKQIPEEYLKAKEQLAKLSYYNKYTNALNSELSELEHRGR